jgi:hypothetical protein
MLKGSNIYKGLDKVYSPAKYNTKNVHVSDKTSGV